MYPGSKHEYTTFLHKEARLALEEYRKEREELGEKIIDESYVFRARFRWIGEKSKPMTGKAARSVISRIIERAGIRRKREENSRRFDVQTGTGFRKRFNTILKSNPGISYAIAERLMDHKTYLEPHYLDTSNKEKLFEEFAKAIPELTVSDEGRQKTRIEKLEKDKSELEKMNGENQMLGDRIARQDQAIAKILKDLAEMKK